MQTLYVGCSLKEATPEFIDAVKTLKASLASEWEVLEFVGLNPEASCAEVYTTDIDCAARADVMLAIADLPSTGLGMELQKRIELKKPTFIAYHEDTTISRMVLGAAEQYDFIEVIRYNDLTKLTLPNP